jgi:BirA family biotin operon repressor/biotin-[acetyl-CoA-carboxylase] ligase
MYVAWQCTTMLAVLGGRPLSSPGTSLEGGRSGEFPRLAAPSSTNSDLLGLSANDAADRTVLVTDHQTAGRGRLARTWDAPPGTNLLMSILFRAVPAQPIDLTRAVGVAAADAVRMLTGLDARLKWPNDVLVDGRKLAGVLAQSNGDDAIVVGIGLNVGWAPDGAARADGTTPHAVLSVLLSTLDTMLASLAEHDDDSLLLIRYRQLLDTRGRVVRVEMPGGEIRGRAIDVERDGALVVLDECAITHRIEVGDVVHLRADEG